MCGWSREGAGLKAERGVAKWREAAVCVCMLMSMHTQTALDGVCAYCVHVCTCAVYMLSTCCLHAVYMCVQLCCLHVPYAL